ncbi:MAG: glycerophosphodiester phosphodiesterase family protein [Pseudomonadota bacterium]
MSNAPSPLVIGHRGASGYLPEHTLPAYALAVLQGADYIEPDLVATRDGVLVARHENEIGATTDVALRDEFASRQRSQRVDGQLFAGWFVEDFTLAELKTLRARERIPQLRPANAAYDGQFEVPTFEEVLQLLAGINASRRIARQPLIGIYPETKHPAHFLQLGLPLEPALLAALDRGLQGAPLFIQSFETANLQQLRGVCDHPLTQLLEGNVVMDAARLETVAHYAQAIGVPKSMVVHEDQQGVLAPTTLVSDAHAAGLAVHVWTLRAENAFLPIALRRGAEPGAHGDIAAETKLHLSAGVDGLFCDQPDLVTAVINAGARSGL